MPAPDLMDLMWRYAQRGLVEWRDAPQELRRRAAACLLNQIAEDDHQASTTIRTTYTEGIRLGGKAVERALVAWILGSTS
jgi:hypothetical protein